jgi:hypothetical protein
VEGGCFKVQVQEFCQRNQIVDSSTTAARLSLPSVCEARRFLSFSF